MLVPTKYGQDGGIRRNNLDVTRVRRPLKTSAGPRDHSHKRHRVSKVSLLYRVSLWMDNGF
jgi:hypothetical protein